MLRHDRTTRGGGVALLIKKPLKYVQLPCIDGTENVWCKLFMNETALIVGVIYRAPGSSRDFLEKLDDYLSEVANARCRLIITGDINLPGVDWDSHTVGITDRHAAKDMLEIMIKYDLIQVVSEPTRIQGQSRAVLGLLFLSQDTFRCKINVSDGISDHRLVVATLGINGSCLQENQKVQVRDFNNADDTSILDRLEMAFDALPDTNDVDTLWKYFTAVVKKCVSLFIPMKLKRLQKSNRWITHNIIHLKRRLRRARRKIPRNPEVIANLSTTVRAELKASKNHFLFQTLTEYMKRSPQKFWRYLSGSKSTISGITVNGTTCNDSVLVAEEFNNYFNSVFTWNVVNSPIFNRSDKQSNDERIIISQEGILSLLLKLDTKKSAGPDMLPNEFLRRYCEWVSQFLFRIFSVSLREGKVPRDWLMARVVPLLKSGDKLNVANYRPISITCTTCEILEHIISKQLVQYIKENKLFYKHQHGFCKRLSTVTHFLKQYTHSQLHLILGSK